jgi:2-pyrone-4,6-dicarboxylate lactonase
MKSIPNDGDLVDAFGDWVPDEAMRKRIMVDNPARSTGFRLNAAAAFL